MSASTRTLSSGSLSKIPQESLSDPSTSWHTSATHRREEVLQAQKPHGGDDKPKKAVRTSQSNRVTLAEYMSPDFDEFQCNGRTLRWLEKQYRRVMNPHKRPKYSRNPFYASDKKRACEMHLANPEMTHQQIADALNVKRSTVTKALKYKARWLETEHHDGCRVARDRYEHYHRPALPPCRPFSDGSSPRFDDLEAALQGWLMRNSAGDVKVTDKMIKERAIHEATRLGYRGRQIPYFHCGRTWLRNFKARFEIVDGMMTGSGYTERDELRAKALGNTDIYFDVLPSGGDVDDIQDDEIRIVFGSTGPSKNQFARWELESPIFRDAFTAGNTRVTFATSSSRDDTQTGFQSTILAHVDPEVDSNPPLLEYAGAKPSIRWSDDVYTGEYRSS